MPQAPRAAVHENDNLPLLNPEHACDGGLEQFLDRLNFKKVVPRPKRAELMVAAVFSAVAHEGGFRLGKGTVILDPVEVRFLSVSVFYRPPGSVFEDDIQFGPCDLHRPLASGSAGDVPEQLIEKLIELPPHIIDGKRRREQPNAAIDVETHATGGNDTLFGICRRNAA